MIYVGSLNTGSFSPDSPLHASGSVGVQQLIAEPPLRQCRNKLRGVLSQLAVDTESRAVCGASAPSRFGATTLPPAMAVHRGTLPPSNINSYFFKPTKGNNIMTKSNVTADANMNVVNLDFTPMLDANDIGTASERDNGQTNPYAHVGYSIVMTNLLRGLYAAQLTAKNHYDRTEEQERAHHVKLGGDRDIIESDDMADNFRKRVAQSKIQWYNITCMVDELRSKFTAITHEEAETFATWLANKEAWARGERKPVANTVDRKKTTALASIADEINVA